MKSYEINYKQTLNQTMALQVKTSEAVKTVDDLRKKAKEIEASLHLQEEFSKSDDLVRNLTNALAENQPFADLVEQNVSAKIDLPVGTILPSLAAPSVFLKGERAKEWAPADGSQISPDSLYAKLTDKIQTPDFRGMFLRGLNAFQEGVVRKDGNQDPDSGRRPGDYQADMFKAHAHEEHPSRGNTWFKVHNRSGTWGNERSGNVKGLKTASAGGAETRPKNIAVYFYIKIN